jgi:hypothetical protein
LQASLPGPPRLPSCTRVLRLEFIAETQGGQLQIENFKLQIWKERSKRLLQSEFCILHFEICNPPNGYGPLTVHSSAAKIGFRSANHERNPIPTSGWCESVMKVFLSKTLGFSRFDALALTVFFAPKKFSEERNAKNLGFYRPNEMQQPRAV